MRLRKAKIIIVPINRTAYLRLNCEDFVSMLHQKLDRQQGEVISAVVTASSITVTAKVTSLSELMEQVVSFASALFKVGELFIIVVRSGPEIYEVRAAICSCPPERLEEDSAIHSVYVDGSAPTRVRSPSRRCTSDALHVEVRRGLKPPPKPRLKVGTRDPRRRTVALLKDPLIIEESGSSTHKQLVRNRKRGDPSYKAFVKRLFRSVNISDEILPIGIPTYDLREGHVSPFSACELPLIEEEDWVH